MNDEIKKADEIVRALRRAERYCLNEYSTMAKQAADLIESLLAEVERFNATLDREGFTELETMIAKYKTVMLAANELSIETDEEVEALREQLKESQRRERAAVEDMTQMANCKFLGDCTFCVHRNTPDMRYKPCKGCERPNRSKANFKWRGAKEAAHERTETML